MFSTTKKPAEGTAVLVIVIALFASPASALDEIYSPNVVKGELGIEYNGSRTFDGDDTRDNAQSHEMELEYGLTDRVVVKASGILEKEPGEDTRFNAREIGSIVQFTEQNEYWVDTGLLLVYSNATHREDPDAIEAKLLLEKQAGRFLHRANFGLEQQVGAHSMGGPDRSFLWSSRYLYDKHFVPGFEIQSDFGQANEHLGYDEQEHYIGPALYGEIIPNVKYEVAYLFGASEASANGAARVKLEYELHF